MSTYGAEFPKWKKYQNVDDCALNDPLLALAWRARSGVALTNTTTRSFDFSAGEFRRICDRDMPEPLVSPPPRPRQ